MKTSVRCRTSSAPAPRSSSTLCSKRSPGRRPPPPRSPLLPPLQTSTSPTPRNPPVADRRYRLYLFLSLAALYPIWGSTYLAIRFAIETLPPFTMAGIRFLIAGAILFLIARLRGEGKPEPRHWAGAALVGTLLLV